MLMTKGRRYSVDWALLFVVSAPAHCLSSASQAALTKQYLND